MKRIALTAAIAAAALLSGCKIESGGSFNPTALGYNLAMTVLSTIDKSAGELNTMRHLDEYISAGEQERVDIQDRYFYSQRIVEREPGVWHIIGGGSGETVVYTGGRRLRESGAKWSYANDVRMSGATIENIADDGQELYRMSAGGVNEQESRATDLTFGFVPAENPVLHERINISGGGYCNSHSETFSYTILSPIAYDPADDRFYGGHAVMNISIDGETFMPEFEISEVYITIRGGLDNAYSKKYSHPRYY